ncbi:helix-turn-helix domain-containing protein [Leucobacter sp. GX24907]
MLTEAGIRIRRQGLDDSQTAHVIRRYASGLTTREIAKELGVGHAMVWRALKREGVELRSQTQRQTQK